MGCTLSFEERDLSFCFTTWPSGVKLFETLQILTANSYTRIIFLVCSMVLQVNLSKKEFLSVKDFGDLAQADGGDDDVFFWLWQQRLRGGAGATYHLVSNFKWNFLKCRSFPGGDNGISFQRKYPQLKTDVRFGYDVFRPPVSEKLLEKSFTASRISSFPRKKNALLLPLGYFLFDNIAQFFFFCLCRDSLQVEAEHQQQIHQAHMQDELLNNSAKV